MRRFTPWILGCVALAPLLTGAAGPARADVIFSNFGPDDSFNHGQARGVVGPMVPIGNPRSTAMPFTPEFTAFFDMAELPLALVFLSPNLVTVQVRANDPTGGGIPGAILEEFQLTNLPVVSPQIFQVVSTLHPLLEAEETYWLAAIAGTPTTWGAWFLTEPPQSGHNATTPDLGATWRRDEFGQGTSSAFRISGTPDGAIPEPATFVLLGAGALGLLGYGWRRRKQSR
jgi:PEP-CTERM motif